MNNFEPNHQPATAACGQPGDPIAQMAAPEAAVEITNQQFLQGLFGHLWHHIFVTGFPDDPSAIPADRRGICWSGNQFQYANGELSPDNNQYYCPSLFWIPMAENGKPGKLKRRKAAFRAMFLLVVDDVREKISVEDMKRLPPAAYVMETSPESAARPYPSEQWGFLFEVPETSIDRCNNLVDGVVDEAAGGIDPGMKGVTRLVRLPEGVNTKAKHVDANGGVPPRCKMRVWEPWRRTTIEELAGTFNIDLNRKRSDSGGSAMGASIWPETSPVMRWLADGNVLEEKGDGEYLIVCPWLDEHTDGIDSGTWMRTLDTGGGEFKCHHGHCQDRGFNDLLEQTGLKTAHDNWRAFSWQADIPVRTAGEVFGDGAPMGLPAGQIPGEVVTGLVAAPEEDPITKAFNDLRGRIADNLKTLCRHYGISIRHNLMAHDIEVMIPGANFLEDERLNLQLITLKDIAMVSNMTLDSMDPMILAAACDNPYHPTLDWLASLPP